MLDVHIINTQSASSVYHRVSNLVSQQAAIAQQRALATMDRRDHTRVAGRVKQVFEYIKHAIEPDGSNRDAVLNRQHMSLVATIKQKQGVISMDDAMDTLALLRSIECPFTAKQSHELRALVDSSSESGDPGAAATTVRSYTKCQTFTSIENYLTEERWTKILSQDTDIDDVIEVIALTCNELGCLNPAPQPSQRWMVAFIYAVLDVKFSGDDAYATLCGLREWIQKMRKHACVGAPAGVSVYPDSGTDFQQMYPHAFPNGPPVPTKIKSDKIQQAFLKTVCRDTNTAVTKKAKLDHKSIVSSPPPTLDQCNPTQLVQGMMHGMMQMLSQSREHIDIDYRNGPQLDLRKRTPSRRRKMLLNGLSEDQPGGTPPSPARLALLDGSSGSSAESSPDKDSHTVEAPTPPHAPATGGVGGLEAMIEATKGNAK